MGGKMSRLLRWDKGGSRGYKIWLLLWRAFMKRLSDNFLRREWKSNISHILHERIPAPWIIRKALLQRRFRRESRIQPGFKKTGDAYSIIERTSDLKTRTSWSWPSTFFKTRRTYRRRETQDTRESKWSVQVSLELKYKSKILIWLTFVLYIQPKVSLGRRKSWYSTL